MSFTGASTLGDAPFVFFNAFTKILKLSNCCSLSISISNFTWITFMIFKLNLLLLRLLILNTWLILYFYQILMFLLQLIYHHNKYLIQVFQNQVQLYNYFYRILSYHL